MSLKTTQYILHINLEWLWAIWWACFYGNQEDEAQHKLQTWVMGEDRRCRRMQRPLIMSAVILRYTSLSLSLPLHFIYFSSKKQTNKNPETFLLFVGPCFHLKYYSSASLYIWFFSRTMEFCQNAEKYEAPTLSIEPFSPFIFTKRSFLTFKRRSFGSYLRFKSIISRDLTVVPNSSKAAKMQMNIDIFTQF